jgi:hypothetical protein
MAKSKSAKRAPRGTHYIFPTGPLNALCGAQWSSCSTWADVVTCRACKRRIKFLGLKPKNLADA